MSGSGSQALPLGEPDHTLNPGKPLIVNRSSAGINVVTPGMAFSLGVTINNKGEQSAIIDVLIRELTPILSQWCPTPQERLALGPQQSGEVVFEFQVPVAALPGTYNYDLVIDAPQHYPEATPILYPQCLQVLPPIQNAIRANDPSFSLLPPTTSAQPAVLPPGGVFQVQVLVYNRANRVDRFRLTCSDLLPNWLSIVYPQGVQGPGRVIAAESLDLNPGEQGQLLVLFHPPLDALAGNYVPTLRLISENQPDLVLLDLVYLQVSPTYLLQTELQVISNKVRSRGGAFQIHLTNAGNIGRSLGLQVKDQETESPVSFTLAASQVQLLPRAAIAVELRVQLGPWWRRPLFGAGRIFNFQVVLEDLEQAPLANPTLPGFIFWEPRPWWQLLPFLLAGLLGLGAIAYGIWWLFWRTPTPPAIAEFRSEDSRYAAVNGDVIRLGWRISQPRRLQTLKIIGQSPEGKPLTRPLVYDFRQGLPPNLQPFCTLGHQELTCRQVRTNARQAGDYIFELTLTANSAGKPLTVVSKTDPVQITPIPLPEILAFASTQPTYPEVPPATLAGSTPEARSPVTAGIGLNWAIAQPEQLQRLKLVGRSQAGEVVSPIRRYDFRQGLPPELQPYCRLQPQLLCQNLPIPLQQPGDYIFELTALPRTGPAQPSIARKTDLIKILPRPPQILSFQLNGQEALPKYLLPLQPGQAVPPLLVSWRVDAGRGTRVELLPAPGTVPLQGSAPYPLSPQPGSFTVILQVTSPTGKQLQRSVTVETFDPSAKDPAIAAAEAAAAAIAAANARQQAEAEARQQAQQQGKLQPGQAPPNSTPATPPSPLVPVELPPQFDRP